MWAIPLLSGHKQTSGGQAENDPMVTEPNKALTAYTPAFRGNI